MVQFKSIELKEVHPFGYARGAKPGYECVVTIQPGEASYEKIKIPLSSEATRDVITLAVQKAMEQLIIDPATINTEGTPGDPVEEEVTEEAPPPPSPTPEIEEVL